MAELTPDAEREDGVLLWRCSVCLNPKSVVAMRHEGQKPYLRVAIEGLDDSTAYIWSCSVCGSVWSKEDFIAARDECEEARQRQSEAIVDGVAAVEWSEVEKVIGLEHKERLERLARGRNPHVLFLLSLVTDLAKQVCALQAKWK